MAYTVRTHFGLFRQFQPNQISPPLQVRKALSGGKGLICVSWSLQAPTDKLR